jgi:phage/plasmid primase-like uncharacterized protein
MNSAIEQLRNAILAALADATLPDVIEPGRLYRFATNGKRGDSAGWCKLFADLRGGVFGDFRTGVVETWTAIERSKMTQRERANLARHVAQAAAERHAEQHRRWARNAERIAALWATCSALVPGDPATLYLKRRGFAGVWPLPACLRYHPALPYWHDGERIGTYPAMLAPLTGRDRRIVALHRTYLTRDGRKAEVPSVKKLTSASGPLAGACIAMFGPEKGCIGIAEGIETALAAWCASSVPTVAAYCAGNLAAWQWPIGVRRIVIFADHDPAGADAADKLRQRARAAGLSVNVLAPTDPGSDWCDVWARRDAAMIEGAQS